MKKNLKMTLENLHDVEQFLVSLQTEATHLKVEGTAEHVTDTTVVMYVQGSGETLDDFIDKIYEQLNGHPESKLSISTFTTPKNFRGVFRIIAS